MNLLARLFGSRPEQTFNTDLGVFRLVHSKKDIHTWSCISNELSYACQGTTSEPDPEQLAFLKNATREISSLNPALTRKFRDELKEAELPAEFSTWEERFSLVGLEVMLISNGIPYWNVTFEDKKSPHAHFNLYMKGEEISDMSIDT
jgi:hypothetical protein